MFLFSPLFCFSFSSLFLATLSFLPPLLHFLLLPCFLACGSFAPCLSSSLLCPLLPPPLSLSPSLSLPLRLQWVWLRGECGVPRLSLAIKAMPTPRLHMSSRPSKRGGVLLIRSVSCNTNTPPLLHAKRPSVRCMFRLLTCCFGCHCLSVSLAEKKKKNAQYHKSTAYLENVPRVQRNANKISYLNILLLYSLKQQCTLVPVTSEYTLRSWRQNYWICLELKYFMIEWESCGLAVLDIFLFFCILPVNHTVVQFHSECQCVLL